MLFAGSILSVSTIFLVITDVVGGIAKVLDDINPTVLSEGRL